MRREIDAVLAGLERAPRQRQLFELLARLHHLVGEVAWFPVEARVARLHRLVALAVEAPVEVEAVDLVPVALAAGIGKTAVERAAGVEADEVAAGRRAHRLLEHRRRRRERAATLDFA